MNGIVKRILGVLRRKNKSIIRSYKSLRQLIGVLGILIPFICFFGGLLVAGLPLQISISAYYHTNARDFFVGLLVCVGFFLMTYKGYELIDEIVTTVSGAGGFCVAFFPCMPPGGEPARIGFFLLDKGLSDTLHAISAAVFFTLLALNSLFLFTLHDPVKEKTTRKKWRDSIYRACGILMLALEVLLVVLLLTIGKQAVDDSKIVFMIETAMLAAFGVSWLVKGGTILKDK
jgi:hypothetical protein